MIPRRDFLRAAGIAAAALPLARTALDASALLDPSRWQSSIGGPPETAQERMAWWREARFGMFVHFGLYSILGGEWGGRTDFGEWIRNNAKIPIDEYDTLLGRFNPRRFDADRMARLAAAAGMKYLVITTKHHDGFCLWPTARTDWNVRNTPYGRDLMRQVVDACRAHGVRPCWYHSIMDWHHPDYLPRRDWEAAARPAAGADFSRYAAFLHAQVEELLTQYGDIGVMWFDGEWEGTWTEEHGAALLEHVHRLSPDTLVNSRVGKQPPGPSGLPHRPTYGDFGTPEQKIPDRGLPGVDWESCITMNRNWGFNRADKDYKSLARLVELLVETASKGGNLLLNIGPDGEGAIPPESVERLEGLAQWMRLHAPAIHGTAASPFEGAPFRATRKGDTIYCFLPTWPADRQLVLPGIATLPRRAWMLEDPDRRPLPCARATDGIAISLPATPSDPLCSVVAIEMPPTVPGAALVPAPRSVQISENDAPWVLREPVRIVVPDPDASWTQAAEWFAELVRRQTGFRAEIVAGAPSRRSRARRDGASTITLRAGGDVTRPESYRLRVAPGGVDIVSPSAIGARWALQTLRQLLPPEFEASAGATRPQEWRIAAVTIDDAPRFPWRGTMLDVARHFLPVADVKRHLELMARYKLNVLHWHLTDDQGWRIEIARYPELTRVGAWRSEADGTRYGGFYTQDEIRDVVAYATSLGITVVPEIELPGHSVAAIASYPSLGCTGAPVEVATTWGVFGEILCVGRPATLEFLTGVLDEVIPLFPAPYVHIGGDEVPKDRWRACERCQALRVREGLADDEALQRWLVDRIGAHLAAKGKRLIGWNEILHGGRLRDGTIVQAWESAEWTARAANEGYDVIASPMEWVYHDRHPGDLTMARVYQFEPLPSGVPTAAQARVLGSEAPFWSERIVSRTNLELMAWPRLLAFSEVLWSELPGDAAARDYLAFLERVNAWQVPRLREGGVAVGPTDRELVRLTFPWDDATQVAHLEVASGVASLAVRMSRDGRAPSANSPEAPSGFAFSEPGSYRLQAFVGNEPVRDERVIEVVAHGARGARVTASPAADARYPGTGRDALADGLRGSVNHLDGLWQGWWGGDVTLELALPAAVPATAVSVGFLQSVRSWIVLPREVEFAWSADGRRWSPPLRVSHDVPVMREGAAVHRLAASLPAGTVVQHLRVVLRSAGPLPEGHPGAGRPAWIFADEIEVR